MASMMGKLVPGLVRVAARVAPDATAEWAARRFLTVRRMPIRPEQAEILGRASRRSFRVEERRITLYEWGAGPTVLLVHGWSGSVGQMTPFVTPLVEQGFRVVTFDAPAHGSSEGRVTHVPEMALAVAAVIDEVGPVHLAIAHSAGATALALAARRGSKVGRVAMIAPAPHPAGWSERFAIETGLRGEVCRKYFRALERLGGMPLEAIRLGVNAPSVRCPVLVVHDADDRLCPPALVREAVRALPRAQRVETRGLGHARILADPGVVELTARFATDAPAPASRVDRWEAVAPRPRLLELGRHA